MILEEWNTEDAIAYAREEGLTEGHIKGFETGIIEGRTEEKLEVARNLLIKGSTHEFIQEITGLSLNEIEKL